MVAFWQGGYEGTSITHLIEATGLQRQGLYNVFGDKHGLFEAVLARYAERVEMSLEPLRSADAGMAHLRAYVEGALAEYTSRDVGACLIVKTAFGPELKDKRIRKTVEKADRKSVV